MLTYSEKSTQLVSDASVAVQVLLGAPDDVEFIPLLPRMADKKMLADISARWPGRGLRTVGIIGLRGASPVIALKEPLEPSQVDALASAFLAYIHVLFRDRFEKTEIAELERLHAMPDMRLPNYQANKFCRTAKKGCDTRE
jgi:hypothetical protein